MRKFKALFVGALALVAFVAATSTASAATLTVSPTSITGTSANTLTFTGGGLTITCPFTLNGTLSSTITSATLTDVLIGNVTGGTPGSPCSGANSLSFLSFPWNILLSVVLNADGSIDVRIKFRDASFNLNVPIAGDCLYRGDVTATRRFASGTSQPLTLSQLDFASQTVPKASGGFLCPSSGGLTGSVALSSPLRINYAL